MYGNNANVTNFWEHDTARDGPYTQENKQAEVEHEQSERDELQSEALVVVRKVVNQRGANSSRHYNYVPLPREITRHDAGQ